jgi:hypothetical protein
MTLLSYVLSTVGAATVFFLVVGFVGDRVKRR